MTEYLLSVAASTPRTSENDPGAAIFEDGRLVYGIEEERLSRNKHAPRTFPHSAITACLDYCDIDFADVDRVLVPWDIRRVGKRKIALLERIRSANSIGVSLLRMERALENKFIARFHPLQEIRSELSRHGPVPDIEMLPHHRCHAASAFYGSGYDSSLVITMDGEGELESTVVWDADAEIGLERVEEYSYRNSLGMFYAAFTDYLGFQPFNGEGKVMGLAAYGSPNEDIRAVLDDLFQRGRAYNVRALCTEPAREGGAIPLLEEQFGRAARTQDGEITDWHRDLAYEVQTFLEDTVVDIVTTFAADIGHENVCVAGGVGLNCKMNQRIRDADAVERCYPFPVAHDAGNAIGAGMLYYAGSAGYTDVYLGDAYTEEHILQLLRQNKIPFSKSENVPQFIAENLSDGAVVGHFHGRTEMGPRALGNRSILADPRDATMKDQINNRVKFREEFRPFAPTILAERADELLAHPSDAPNMVQTFTVTDRGAEALPAATHVDNTVRPQILAEERNPRFYSIIERFEERTGVPAVLNTSLNIRGEPIVNTPSDALTTFFGTGMDILVLNGIVIEKSEHGS